MADLKGISIQIPITSCNDRLNYTIGTLWSLSEKIFFKGEDINAFRTKAIDALKNTKIADKTLLDENSQGDCPAKQFQTIDNVWNELNRHAATQTHAHKKHR